MPRLAVAFFASGFAALLCQIVWQRMLGIFAGSDTISAALVVGAFLAGLGIGSIIGAKIADRITPARAFLNCSSNSAPRRGYCALSCAYTGASMKDTWFLVMTRPFTFAAMPLTSIGPLAEGACADADGAMMTLAAMTRLAAN